MFFFAPHSGKVDTDLNDKVTKNSEKVDNNVVDNDTNNGNDKIDIVSFKQKLLQVKQQIDNGEIDEIPLYARPKMLDFDYNKDSYVIVSYSRKDFVEVYLFLAYLYNEGYRFWFDDGMHGPEDWTKEFRGMFENKNCLGAVTFFSDNYISTSTQKELSIIYEDGKYKKKNDMILLVKNKNDSISKITDTKIKAKILVDNIVSQLQMDERLPDDEATTDSIKPMLTQIIEDVRNKTVYKYRGENDIKGLIHRIGRDFNIQGTREKERKETQIVSLLKSTHEKSGFNDLPNYNSVDPLFFDILRIATKNDYISEQWIKDAFHIDDKRASAIIKDLETLEYIADIGSEKGFVILLESDKFEKMYTDYRQFSADVFFDLLGSDEEIKEFDKKIHKSCENTSLCVGYGWEYRIEADCDPYYQWEILADEEKAFNGAKTCVICVFNQSILLKNDFLDKIQRINLNEQRSILLLCNGVKLEKEPLKSQANIHNRFNLIKECNDNNYDEIFKIIYEICQSSQKLPEAIKQEQKSFNIEVIDDSKLPW